MTARQVIIDCDPGQDDALNLFLAFASPEAIEILGITTVAGNVPLALTERNARLLCELAGREDVPVFAGCARPILVEPRSAQHVHGESGIDGLPICEPRMKLQAQHGVDFIIETLMAAADRSITLVPTGPLTNIGMALIKEPRIAGKIERIVLMGGAMREGGNITPSAEFNIWVDPHAADVVFRCGRPIVAHGLDVSHQVLVTQAVLARIKALNNPVARASHDMLSFFNRFDSAKYGSDGAPLHDACTMAYLLKPDLFRTKSCSVVVETASELTRGHTAVDFWSVTEAEKHVEWAYAVDEAGFFDLLIERLDRFSAAERISA